MTTVAVTVKLSPGSTTFDEGDALIDKLRQRRFFVGTTEGKRTSNTIAMRQALWQNAILLHTYVGSVPNSRRRHEEKDGQHSFKIERCVSFTRCIDAHKIIAPLHKRRANTISFRKSKCLKYNATARNEMLINATHTSIHETREIRRDC